MAKHIISDCGIFYAGYDFTGTMNQTEVTLSRDELEQTTFGDATRNFLPGLLTATATASGFFDATLSGCSKCKHAFFFRRCANYCPKFDRRWPCHSYGIPAK